VQHHAQDAVDAEPGMPEAGVCHFCGGFLRFMTMSRSSYPLSGFFVSASHAARCVACHGVRSHPVPVAVVGECSIPVV
jgi:hypothetical protein